MAPQLKWRVIFPFTAFDLKSSRASLNDFIKSCFSFPWLKVLRERKDWLSGSMEFVPRFPHSKLSHHESFLTTASDLVPKRGMIRVSNVRIKVRLLEVNVIKSKLGKLSALLAMLTLGRIRQANCVSIPASFAGQAFSLNARSCILST